MKKLVKPTKNLETASEELVFALCDYDNCDGNCKKDDQWCKCKSVGSDVEGDEDILF